MQKRLLFISMVTMTVLSICLAGCGNAGSSDNKKGVGAGTIAASDAQVQEAAETSEETTENTENVTQTEKGTMESTENVTQTEEESVENTENVIQTEEGKTVAKDGADIQTDDSSMPTRIPMEGGTRINMYFGDKVIPGMLNDSDTAKALIEKLPMTQHVSRYSHDFCGVTEELPYKEDEVHYGWLNGDIDYATDAPYFTILFEDEDVSEQYGYQVNIGVITCPLEEIAALQGSYDVRIELAE